MSDRLRGLQVNFQMLTVLAVIVLAVVTLAPTVQTLFVQRQQIADLQHQVEQAKKAVADMTEERKRWEDPVYVRAQARDRLYYVMPGEVSYLVMDAQGVDMSDTTGTVGEMLAERANTTEITTNLRKTKQNWVDSVLYSVVRAGLDEPTETKATN
jgi:cell division protein FtsB